MVFTLAFTVFTVNQTHEDLGRNRRYNPVCKREELNGIGEKISGVESSMRFWISIKKTAFPNEPPIKGELSQNQNNSIARGGLFKGWGSRYVGIRGSPGPSELSMFG